MSDMMMTILEDPLVGALARLGERYDNERAHPADSIALLVEAGLLHRFAPVESGGEAFADAADRHHAMFDALRRVGRGDLSVGRLFEGHVNAMALFGWYATARQKDWLRGALDRGAAFGVWATEPAPGVALVDTPAGRALDGAKSFASGAGGIGYAIVTVQPESGDRRLAIVGADDLSRTDASGWRVRGMRASMSGAYDLTGYPIDDEALIGAPGDYDREPRFTAGAWRFLAVQLGGIEGLLIETRRALSDTARGDPVQRARFADAVAAARTAYLWIREAADRATREEVDSPIFVQMCRGIVERAALDVMEASARLIGTRSAFDGERIDKISRDLSLYLRQAGRD